MWWWNARKRDEKIRNPMPYTICDIKIPNKCWMKRLEMWTWWMGWDIHTRPCSHTNQCWMAQSIGSWRSMWLRWARRWQWRSIKIRWEQVCELAFSTACTPSPRQDGIKNRKCTWSSLRWKRRWSAAIRSSCREQSCRSNRPPWTHTSCSVALMNLDNSRL